MRAITSIQRENDGDVSSSAISVGNTPAQPRYHWALNFVFSISLTIALLGFLSSGLRFLDDQGVQLVSGVGWKVAAAIAFVIAFFQLFRLWGRIGKRIWGVRFEAEPFTLTFLSEAAAFGMLLLLLSDFVTRRFIFYVDSTVRADILCTGLLALAAAYIFRARGATSHLTIRMNGWMLLFVQLVIAALFLKLADHRLLFSDDHPSFLYRLQLLKEHFPRIPFFNTDWNAGYSAREFYAVGVLSVFFLSWPIVAFANLNTVSGSVIYTYLIPYLFVLILPWSSYCAGRILRLSRAASLLAGLLALGPSMGFFEWMLKFGTLGFAVSCGLVPLTLALCIRLAVDEEAPRWWHIIALLGVSFCCLAWTLNFVAFLPVLIVSLFGFRRTFERRRIVYIGAFSLLYLLVNIGWITSFMSESRVLTFLTKSTLPGSNVKSVFSGRLRPPADEDDIEEQAAIAAERLAQGAPEKAAGLADKNRTPEPESRAEQLLDSKKHLQNALVRVNPLILLFSLPGFFLIRQRRVRAVLALTALWLLSLGAFGDLFKPQLELRRMVITASFVLVLLAAPAIQELLDRALKILDQRSSRSMRALAAATVVLLAGVTIVSPITVASAYSNRTAERFVFAPPLLNDLSEAIRKYGGSGRTFFLSFILHEFGASNSWIQNGGHVAPLATFSGKELFAFEFFHRRWAAHDPIPEEFRKRDDAGVEEFLDLMNVTAVVTFTPSWTSYCKGNSRYREVFDQNRFHLFVRSGPPEGYFYKGQGRIERVRRHLVVTPETDEVVIKYRYLRKLEFEPSDLVDGYRVPMFTENKLDDDSGIVDYIGLRARPGKTIRNAPITIRFPGQ